MNERKVSVLIVGRNEEANLPRLFDSLKKLTYPKKNYEIVYIDDASSDKSAAIAKRYGARIFRTRARLGRGGIRNFALTKARYPVIAWIDADCEVVDADWIQDMLVHLRGRTVGVSGHQLRPKGGLPRLISYLPGMLIETERVGTAQWAPTTSSAFLRKPLQDIGGYRNDLITAEDLEICARLRKRGYTFVHTPRARIVHHFRATLPGFIKQQYERGVFGAALKRNSERKTLFDVAFNASYLIAALTTVLGFAYPVLFIPSLVAPALFYTGLDGVGFFPRIVWRYMKEEKSPLGAGALVALNYIKNAALFAGVLAYQLTHAGRGVGK
ncbi:MAG: glycosyltransferase [Candidatus Aenigmatarchaeota archaeon]|nr:MAG: glycosyltransferase [Candidatus Aenigmarchaeota archaeon]